MDKSLETYNLLSPSHTHTHTQNKTENLNKSVINNKIESGIKTLPTKKSRGLDGFTGDFYQTFKELTPIIFQFFKK